MDLSQSQGWILVIAAIGANAVLIINALKSKQNGQKLDVLGGKADDIHVLTNSNLTSVKADLAIALKDIVFLKEFISKNTPVPVPDPEKPEPEFIARVELAPPPTSKPFSTP